jgi:hypothetical protein
MTLAAGGTRALSTLARLSAGVLLELKDRRSDAISGSISDLGNRSQSEIAGLFVFHRISTTDLSRKGQLGVEKGYITR